jgi:SAM-dependent methyltransferase
MKPFSVYQYLEGEQMTDRDKIEVGSKFWNKGKWDNFILSLLPDTCQEMTFIDIGCNKGLFLHLAEQKGFGQVIGVDSDVEAVNKGEIWRVTHGGKYRFICDKMENVIDTLPLADYTILVNTHYYFTINDWLDFIDKLQYKTRYVIIVTAEKHHKQLCWASADIQDIRGYFKDWKEVRFIDSLPADGDPMPRKLWSLKFASPHLERVKIENIRSRNSMQNGFFSEIDKGVPFRETNYYKVLREYRHKWSENHLNNWFEERVRVFEDVKKNQLTRPIYVNSDNVILDGNHRYQMMKDLGYKSLIIRKV